jgi:hypothetical protein
MNNFFYDLNKRLATLADKQDAAQLAESTQAETVAQSPLTQALMEAPKQIAQLKKKIADYDEVKRGIKWGKQDPLDNPYGEGGSRSDVKSKTKGTAATNRTLKSNIKRSLGTHSSPVLPEAEELDERSTGDYSAKAGRAGKDIGKPGKNFEKIAKSAGKAYGSKAAGERVAGAVLNKLRHPKESMQEGTCPSCDCSPCKCDSMEESALQAYLGNKKYGKQGMDALRKAGREHAGKAKMDQIRNRYDKMDEADMEEGNAFTGALAKTPKGSKFKVGGKEFTDTSDLEEGFEEMDAWLAKREKEKGTGKFDVKDTGYSKRYTRKHEDDIESDDEDEVKSNAPKKKGRPKSAKPKDQENVTKGSWKYKMVNGKRVKKEKTKEGLDSDGVMMTRATNCSSESIEHGEQAEYNDEAGMTKDSLHTIVRHAKELERALRDNENLPEWVQEKIGQIKGMMSSVTDYIISTHERDAEHDTGREGITIEPVAERSKSQAQARMMAGAAHNPKFAKKVGVATKVAKEFNKADTGKDISKLPKKVKKTEEGAKPDFLDMDKDGNKKEPMKKAVADKKEKKVDETTTSGSVATATSSGKSSGGSMQFGKGVYESIDKKFKQALTESISVESKMSECGDGTMAPAITITADGEEAAKLMMLLKLAGLESQIPAACPTCGGSPCGCDEMVDENSPDWPTNTEKLDAEPNLRTYSGGLNGPKSTGQTTVPVVASQLRRQASMEESVKIERSLFKNWQQYKG